MVRQLGINRVSDRIVKPDRRSIVVAETTGSNNSRAIRQDGRAESSDQKNIGVEWAMKTVRL